MCKQLNQKQAPRLFSSPFRVLIGINYLNASLLFDSLGIRLVELILSDTGTHGSGRADTTSDHLLELVNVGGATPLLVLDDVDLLVHLGLLHQLAVGAHADGAVGLGELVADQGGGVKTGEGDELPAVSELGEAADISLLLSAGHGALPVERGRKVVGEPRGKSVSFAHPVFKR